MSDHDKENIKSVIRELFKTYWPVLVFLLALMWGAIKLTVSLTSTYDNDVAKKSDIIALGKDVNELSKEVSDLAIRFNAYRNQDSSERVQIKNELSNHIQDYKALKKRIFSSYGERYYYQSGVRKVVAN